jgi:magnesium transporter
MARETSSPERHPDGQATESLPEDLEDMALRDDYALDPAYVAMVIDSIDAGNTTRLGELLNALDAPDVADLMGFVSADYRREVIRHVAADELGSVLSELEWHLREDILEALSPDDLARALGDLDSDDAADVLDDLEDSRRDVVLAQLPVEERVAIQSTLAYDEDSAGRLMQREVLAAPQFWTVGQTIEHIRDQGDSGPELFFDVYVVDPRYRPVGGVPLSRLLRAGAETPLSSIMDPVTEIDVALDREEVAYVFDKYHLISAPVVEPGGRLVGQITVDDVVGVIQEEASEDILALAGVSDAGRDADLVGMMRSRLPWLLVNLITAAIAASVIGAFQDEIAKLTVLAVLMPIVSSLGGNAATQTLAVAVRALAANELNASNAVRIVGRELLVGLANGVAVGSAMAAICWFVFHDLKLALTMGLALIINLFLAALVGILAPMVLDRMGRDPAVSSVIFVTFATDSAGFFCFLGLATIILL